MNTVRDRVGIEEATVRAKHLRPKWKGRESGVFKAVVAHAEQNAAPANDPVGERPATEQAGKPRVCKASDLDRALAALLNNALRADGLSSSDAAAACNRQRQQVDEMRKADGRVRMSAKDLIRICGVSESLHAAVCDLLEQVRNK